MLYLISLLSFLLPFQLAIHFNNFQNSVYGFRIDYLIPTIYLTDVVALLIIAFGLKYLKITKRFVLFSTLYIFFVLLNIYTSDYFISSIYKWLKITELVLLGIIIFNIKKFDIFKNFLKPLSYSVFVVCLLGIWQFLIRGSIGGIFYWLGERSFIFNEPNIAPYPYSTFSHPNSFAGFLLVFGIFAAQLRNKFNPRYFWVLVTLVATNLILTNSLNVYITAMVILLIKLRNIKALPLFFIDLNARYITHRIELIKSAFTMIKENFWTGVGLNNFIPNLVKVSNTFINAWELQPVHNIFLLVFSEIGIFGFVIFCIFVLSSLTLNNYTLLAVLTTGLSDHYWLTLQQNMLLFTYVLVITKRYAKK